MSQPNKPPKPEGSKKDQVTNLNADDLKPQELEEKLLEDAAGGTEIAPCLTHDCTNNWC